MYIVQLRHRYRLHRHLHRRLVIDTIAEYYAHLVRATGLLACCRVASLGRNTAARVSASPLHLYRRPLCIDECVVQSLMRHSSAQDLRLANWVFIIEMLLPVPSLSPTRQLPPHVVVGPYSPMSSLPYCFFGLVRLNLSAGLSARIYSIFLSQQISFSRL